MLRTANIAYAEFLASSKPLFDHLMLFRKSGAKRVLVAVFGVSDPEFEVRQPNDVVRICTRRELQCAVGQPGKQSAKLSIGSSNRPDATDVVNAGSKRPVPAPERLRQPARHRVLLEH
jgi:hypothetical protein